MTRAARPAKSAQPPGDRSREDQSRLANLFLLPLAATGSEMHTFAVISDTTKSEKWGTGSPLFQPKMLKTCIKYGPIACTDRFFKDELRIPMTLREVGITSQDKFDIMAEKAARGSVGSYVPLTKEDIIGIFKVAF